MKPRYVLAPEAARDLVQIWSYLKEHASQVTAEHVESVIRERIVFLSENPGAGHRRRDLTDYDVRFFRFIPTWSSIGRRPTRYRWFPSCMAAAM